MRDGLARTCMSINGRAHFPRIRLPSADVSPQLRRAASGAQSTLQVNRRISKRWSNGMNLWFVNQGKRAVLTSIVQEARIASECQCTQRRGCQ